MLPEFSVARKYVNQPSGLQNGVDIVRNLFPWDALRTMMDSACRGVVYNFLLYFFMCSSQLSSAGDEASALILICLRTTKAYEKTSSEDASL